MTDPLLCGQKSLTASPRSSRRNTDEASVPHKSSITHQLETDIPGSPPPNPPDLLDTQVQKSTAHSENWVCWPLEQKSGFGEEKKKKSSRFPSNRVVPSPKTTSTLIQENLRVVAMAARLSFFPGCWSQDCLVSLTQWREIHVSEEFETDLQHTSSIKPLLAFTRFLTLNDLCCSCWWDQKKKA